MKLAAQIDSAAFDLALLLQDAPDDEDVRKAVQNLLKVGNRYLYPRPPELKAGFSPVRDVLGRPLFCEVCEKPQFLTKSGAVCENGHGGVDGFAAENRLDGDRDEKREGP
jgi:hypothetical protein